MRRSAVSVLCLRFPSSRKKKLIWRDHLDGERSQSYVSGGKFYPKSIRKTAEVKDRVTDSFRKVSCCGANHSPRAFLIGFNVRTKGEREEKSQTNRPKVISSGLTKLAYMHGRVG
jgi:hypothetical protein